MADRDAIVAEWERRVLADGTLRRMRALEPQQLRDFVPRLIDALAASIPGNEVNVSVRDVIRVHIAQRCQFGCSPSEIRTELGLLGEVLRARVPAGSLVSEVVASALLEARSEVDEQLG